MKLEPLGATNHVPRGLKLKSPTSKGFSFEVRSPTLTVQPLVRKDRLPPGHPAAQQRQPPQARNPRQPDYSGSPTTEPTTSPDAERFSPKAALRAEASSSSSPTRLPTNSGSPQCPRRAGLLCAAASKAGHHASDTGWVNQDDYVIEQHKESGSLLLAVFDGHGVNGHHFSGFMRKHLAETLFAHGCFAQLAAFRGETTPQFQLAIKAAISDSLKDLEKSAAQLINCTYSGSTAVVAVVRGKHMTVANVGDSRLLVLSQAAEGGGLVGRAVTRDHKPDRPDERARIVARRGSVRKHAGDEDFDDAPHRVYVSNTNVPGLAMSRSLGDVVAHSVGVLSAPEFHQVQLQPTDRAVLLASDGLFDVIGNPEIAAVAGAQGGYAPSHSAGKGRGGAAGERKLAPGYMVNKLCQRAADRYDECNEEPDDITVVAACVYHQPQPVPASAEEGGAVHSAFAVLAAAEGKAAGAAAPPRARSSLPTPGSIAAALRAKVTACTPRSAPRVHPHSLGRPYYPSSTAA
jgi:serine/threonine protein phosphatase PrpC